MRERERGRKHTALRADDMVSYRKGENRRTRRKKERKASKERHRRGWRLWGVGGRGKDKCGKELLS